MTQPIPLWAGRFESNHWRRLGLGDACPDIAPYPNLAYPGRCTNVPPEQQGVLSAPISTPSPSFAPVTNAAIVAANNDARFGLQLTADEATQRQLADEAIAEGRALGVPVSCEVVHNTAPAMGPLAASSLYQALCTVGGSSDRQSAAQLVKGNGWQIYSTNTGVQYVPLPVSAGTKSTAPSTSATATGQPLPASAANSWPSATLPASLDDGSYDPGSILQSLADKAGVPSWVLIAGAAAAAFMVLGGKR